MMNAINETAIKESGLNSIISKDLAIFHGSSYGKIHLERTTSVNISSTEVRNKLKNRENLSNFMPSELQDWLLKNKIY